MDFLDLIITIAILAVGGLLTGNKKGKKAAGQQAAENGPVAGPRPFQSLFEDDEEPSLDQFDDSWSENVEEEEVEEKPKAQEDALGRPYFSYENQPFQQTEAAETEAEKPITVASEDQGQLSGLLGESFDLRKAFIYQTIMERVEC